MPEETLDTQEILQEQVQKPPEQLEPKVEFTDSRGIERRSEYPVVLLDQEAQQAVDDYYGEHDQLANTAEQTIDLAGGVATLDFSEKTFLTEVQVDLSGATEAPGKTSDTAAQAESGEEENLTEEQKALRSITDSIDQLDAEIKGLVVFPPDMKFKDLKSFYEALPANIRAEIDREEGVPDFGMGARFSKGKQSHIATQVVLGLSRYESHLKEQRRLQSQSLAEELSKQLADGLGESVSEVQIPVPDSCQFEKYESPNNQEAVQQGKTPTENIEVLQKNITRMQDLEQASHQLSAVTDVVDSAMQDPSVQRALSCLDTLDQDAVLREVNYAIVAAVKESGVLESLAALEKGKQFALELAAIETAAATYAVYQEVALPVDYASDAERSRLQQLEEKRAARFDKTPRVAPDEAARRIAEARKQTLGEIVEAGVVYYHTSGYMEAILAAGELQPKQQQIDSQGVLHEQMQAAHLNTRGQVATHSSVPHFAKHWQEGYMQGRGQVGFHDGVVALPIGAIVEHAPFDINSKQLKVLPSARDGQWAYTGFLGRGSGEYNDDYVFYASPEFETSDDYSLPIAEGAIAVIDNPADPVEVPEALTGKVVVVQKAGDLLGEIGFSDQVEAVKERYKGKKVVPLRQAPLDFEPESPAVPGKQFRNKPLRRRELDTSGLQTRQHTNQRERSEP